MESCVSLYRRKYSYTRTDTNKQQLNKCSRQDEQQIEGQKKNINEREREKKNYARVCMWKISCLIATRLIFCCHN
jgi:hypothetical protein